MTLNRKMLTAMLLAVVLTLAVPGSPVAAGGPVVAEVSVNLEVSGPDQAVTRPPLMALSTVSYNLATGADGVTLSRQTSRPGDNDANALRSPMATSGAEARHWSEVNRLWPVGTTARMIDVETGRSFEVVRQGGWAHVDAEPLTWSDTKTMLENYGGRWSWARRPVVVVVGELRLAASQNGMPHGRAGIVSNGMSGHFCIHFLGSTTHGSSYTTSGRPMLDPAHQRAVLEAVGR